MLKSPFMSWITGPYRHTDKQRGQYKMMTSALIDRYASALEAPPGWVPDLVSPSPLEVAPIIEAEVAL